MFRTFLTLIPLAVGIVISPIPVIAISLILAGPRARTNGIAFAAGWTAVLALVTFLGIGVSFGLVVVDALDVEVESTHPGIDVLLAALGVVLIVMALRQWRGRPGPDVELGTPGWLVGVDEFSIGRSAGMAALLAIRPKNLVLMVAAVSAIAGSGQSWPVRVGLQAAFVAMASVAVVVPVAGYLIRGDRVLPALVAVRGFVGRHLSSLLVAVMLMVGVFLIAAGVVGVIDDIT
jgi:hypothetical protein